MLDSFRLNGNSLGYYSDVNLVLKIPITRCARFGSLVAGLIGLSRVIRSSYLCRRVLPLIDCELEQVLGGLTENEDNSGAGALFKVSCLEFVDGDI